MDEIKRLMDKVIELTDSDENNRRMSLYNFSKSASKISHGLVPAANSSRVPFIAQIGPAFYARLLNFSLKKHYNDPSRYLKNTLKIKIAQFTYFNDDTPISTDIPISFGVPFESSLFGVKPIFTDKQDPWPSSGRYPLTIKKDLQSLDHPNFYKSGLMPLAIKFYEEISAMVNDRFNVLFTDWFRSPWSVAVQVRGMDKILIDLIDDPDFVHSLMSFITESREEWVKDRANYLKEEIGKGDLYNDEVNSPMLSKDFYQEFILPYEKRLCDFYNGIGYWHSCGNVTPLARAIKEIPGLDMMHISPWNDDLEKMVKVFKDIPLEICLHPVEDVFKANKNKLISKINHIEYICKQFHQSSHLISTGALESLQEPETEKVNINKCINIVSKTLS